MSIDDIHTNPINIAPHKLIAKIKLNLVDCVLYISSVNFNKPYPPSFNKIPARIIDPLRGASTWAFGSHKCTPHIGNLTRKAVTIHMHIK